MSVANHWIVKTTTKRHPREETTRGLALEDYFFVFLPPSVQVKAVQPVQKRALCIQTAGCYGQSGNGGQGTDRGRGSRPVDSHHSHHGRLSSTERLVPHSCGDNWRSRVCNNRSDMRPCWFLKREHGCFKCLEMIVRQRYIVIVLQT